MKLSLVNPLAPPGRLNEGRKLVVGEDCFFLVVFFLEDRAYFITNEFFVNSF
jgi:hypothetical protein